jgi:proton-translocating NADH-quinone oxidoreductase chain M
MFTPSKSSLIVYSLVFPVIGTLVLLLIPSKKKNFLKLIALNFSCAPFLIALYICGTFNQATSEFQCVREFFWLPGLNINFTLGLDGISVFFVLLTTLLIPLCLLNSWNIVDAELKEFLIAFLVLEFFLVGAFCVLDLLFFYIFFESVLIPMFLVIGIWGSRERKVLASYYFFLYTLFGSVLALLAIVYVHFQAGTTQYEILLTFCFSVKEQKPIWLAFFIAFAGKVPMLPIHLWLPEAHVEAPTAGSVILAGVLLKLGTYGFLRFSLPICPKASFYFTPLVYTVAVLGIIYASLTAIRQSDFKRIIAYTSISHMNLVVLGIFSFTSVGIEGSIIQSLSHGFVASALFLIVGVVYERYKTRIVQYYGGLVTVMPVYVSFFLFFTMANISFPGTSSFVGEFMILTGSFKINSFITFFGASSVVTGGAYSLWLFNRISYGNLKTQHTKKFADLTYREFITLLPLTIGVFVMGIRPKLFLDSISMSVNCLIELIYF